MFNKYRNIKKIGLVLIGLALVIFLITNVRIRSVDSYRKQFSNMADSGQTQPDRPDNNDRLQDETISTDNANAADNGFVEKAIENKNVRLARIIQSKQDETDSDDEVTVATVDDLNSIKPLEMMKRIYSRNSAGAQMSESLEKLLCSVMNDVEKEEDGL